jgi:hypothetical protein
VLGCYDRATSTITMIQGWNWYTGADPAQTGPDQYDFETTVIHELGHALGLGHANDPGSPMFGSLVAGTAHRTMSTPDLNIPATPGDADPLTAAGFPVAQARAAITSPQVDVPSPASVLVVGVPAPVAPAPPPIAGLVPLWNRQYQRQLARTERASLGAQAIKQQIGHQDLRLVGSPLYDLALEQVEAEGLMTCRYPRQ